MDFIKRLVALIPPPRSNIVRYHGVFAPNANDRAAYVAKKNTIKEVSESNTEEKPYRLGWAKLMAKVFKIDVEECHCGGRLKFIAAVLETAATVAILKSLEIEVFFPNPSSARPPPLFDEWSCNEYNQ